MSVNYDFYELLLWTVFELPGGGLKTVFPTPLTHCEIMIWEVSYILYTYSSHHNFGRAPGVENFNPS